ncbi:sensor histidine kinase [Streptomyces sp. NPDC050534]|uniref:sensor histidine kinase n=1 Tax=Streptomyces sp. NPDC050534 TaxID=3365625 RepID=UPI0037A51D82
MSLRNRVALAGSTVVLLALAAASAVLYPLISARLSTHANQTLVAATRQAPELLSAFKLKEATAAEASGRIPDTPLQIGGTTVQFALLPAGIGSDGKEFVALTRRDFDVAAGRSPAYFHDAAWNGSPMRVYSAALADAPGILVRAAVPAAEVDAPLSQLREVLAVIVFGGTLLAAVGARLAANRVLGPVRRLTEAIEHAGRTQDLSAEVEAGGRDEIGRLSRAFAAMITALDRSVRSQRRLVADTSHELRTPLTSLTTNLELLGEDQGLDDPQAPQLLRDALCQAHELAGLVNDLVDLSRYGQQSVCHTEDTRLDELALRVVERARARGTRVRLELVAEPCMVHGDPEALERAIGNLVDNALKFSPPGEAVRVQVTRGGLVGVTDVGPGIPETDLPYVFDRFYRSPAARSLPGSGLGLAIVRQIAENHGGMVSALPQARGVRLELLLPTLCGDRTRMTEPVAKSS